MCPHRAPPAASRREQVRPEDGGAAPDSKDLVPPPGAARSPRTDCYPDLGPHRQMEKPRHRTWEDGASRAQRSLVPIPQPRLPPGYIRTLSEARSTHARPSASQVQGANRDAQDPPRKVEECACHLACPSPRHERSKASATLEEEFLLSCGHRPRTSTSPALSGGAMGRGKEGSGEAQPDMRGLLLGEGQWAPPPACQVPTSLSPGVPRRCWGPHWSLCSQLPSSLSGIRG